MAEQNSKKLSNSQMFFYGLTDMPVMLALFPALVFIPKFYSSDVGISLALVGSLLFVVRLMDVVTDPLMGYISDRLHTPFGRRKPWVVLSTPILMLSVYMLYFPAEGVGGAYLFGWMALLTLGVTMMIIPYYAWGAELSTDYHERSKITGWRAALGTFGQFLAQLVPAIALACCAIGGSRNVLELVGYTMLIVMPVAVFLTVTFTPASKNPRQTPVPVVKGLKLMFKNAAFTRLIVAFFIGSVGLNITTPLYLFFVSDVLGSENEAIYMLSCFYLANILSIPFWVWLSNKISKHKAYIAAYLTIACAHPCYLLLGPGDFLWMFPITIVTGMAAGGFSQTLPNSMKADVIDSDAVVSGENRSAQFFAAWSFVQKLAAAFGVFVALNCLSLIGYDAQLGPDNAEAQMFGLRFLFSTFPSIFFIVGALIVWKYPITKEKFAEIRAELDDAETTKAAPSQT